MPQTRRQPQPPARRTATGTAELAAAHDRAAAGPAESTGPPPRPEIGDSWERLRRLGLSPDSGAAATHLTIAEVEHRRRASGLDEVLSVLRATLLEPAGATPLILAIADAEGHILWHEGERRLRRDADGIGFTNGARWVEETVGTNGIGTTLRTGRPMQVHSAEHYLRSHHSWTCVAAPVHDPRTGRLAGIVNLSGLANTVQPHLLQLAATAARLAETELRARQLESLHHLRTLATPLLARVQGPALVVDGAGWTAAAVGLPPPTRLRLPTGGWQGATLQWLPSLGECAVEPLADGWLVRPVLPPDSAGADTGADTAAGAAEQTEGARVRLDLRRPDRPELSAHGAAGAWSHALSPRHAELLLLLATRPDGYSAAQLADAVFGDPGRTVTVRAELSRLRRFLGGLIAHRPYRFADSVAVRVEGPDEPYDLLPGSVAPAVRRLRVELAAGRTRLPGAGPVRESAHPSAGHSPGTRPRLAGAVPVGPVPAIPAQSSANRADSCASVGP